MRWSVYPVTNGYRIANPADGWMLTVERLHLAMVSQVKECRCLQSATASG